MFDCEDLRIGQAGLTCRLQTYLNSIGHIPIAPPAASQKATSSAILPKTLAEREEEPLCM
ncbi:hypothetical protein B5K05_25465 [Rhizobium phaseoli]|nr:hypothetical protein Bra5_PD00302 [Rhizobium phaseoli Brasil 5]KEC70503.1 hypothetical protein RLPCCGM1_p1294 [Rhizobium leguminosarum bv. phaseoli CCGM1]KKZ83406.1 hypothetical protein RPHASCH2410_PD00570 [Rhizobium phaseoli Ch24-10]PDS68107.1 hypothetical protein CO651_31010 [Rhizobium phaseoli]PWI51764.1 hypothetical protein B5K03_22860 [Rhizobium phaseoli]